MDKKQELVQDRMQQLRMRLAALANGTVSLELLSKAMVSQMNGLASAGETTAFNAAHLRKLFTGNAREAFKLAGVATDAEVARAKCKGCEEAEGWSEKEKSAEIQLGLPQKKDVIPDAAAPKADNSGAWPAHLTSPLVLGLACLIGRSIL